ncbi:MAG: hypothetical protein GY798_15855 [Hyphomicrobiales bacterium]|nr:hypothetical protein [Hyphomicrobiales bacterium]
MASFKAYEAANTTGSGSGTTFPDGPITASVFDTSVTTTGGGEKVTYKGTGITVAGPAVTGGSVSHIDSFPEFGGDKIAEWHAGYSLTVYSAVTMFSATTDKEFFKYIFSDDDYIEGSPFKDKLSGFKGDDYIFSGDGNDKNYGGKGDDIINGGAGKDKNWGDKGKDIFVFAKDSDVERIKDLNKKKDAIYIDPIFVKNFHEVQKAAKQKGDKVVMNFGDGDKLIIDDLNVNKLSKVSISYVDFFDVVA